MKTHSMLLCKNMPANSFITDLLMRGTSWHCHRTASPSRLAAPKAFGARGCPNQFLRSHAFGRAVNLLIALLALLAVRGHAESPHGFVAHGWGTFTSVQGTDGLLLAWPAQV